MCCLLFFSPKSKDSHWYALLIHPISAGNPVDPEGTPPANLGHKSGRQSRNAVDPAGRPPANQPEPSSLSPTVGNRGPAESEADADSPPAPEPAELSSAGATASISPW